MRQIILMQFYNKWEYFYSFIYLIIYLLLLFPPTCCGNLAAPILKTSDLDNSQSDNGQLFTWHQQVPQLPGQVEAQEGPPEQSRALSVLRAWAVQFAGAFTATFNLSLAKAAELACFKTTSIVLLPKHSSLMCLNDYHPVALTPIVRARVRLGLN